eukprot:jgi/Chrzof1/15240/Cz09g32190.t1
MSSLLQSPWPASFQAGPSDHPGAWQDFDCVQLEDVLRDFDTFYTSSDTSDMTASAPESPLSERYNSFMTSGMGGRQGQPGKGQARLLGTAIKPSISKPPISQRKLDKHPDIVLMQHSDASIPCSNSTCSEADVMPHIKETVTNAPTSRWAGRRGRKGRRKGPCKAAPVKHMTRPQEDSTAKTCQPGAKDCTRPTPNIGSFSGLLQPFTVVKMYGKAGTLSLEQLNHKIKAAEGGK